MGSLEKGNRFFDLIRKLFIITHLDAVLVIFVRGKESNSIIGKLAPNNYQHNRFTYRTFKHKGVIIYADISDYVGHYLYYGFKDLAHEKLLQLLKKDDIVLDIGTNIGSTILLIAKNIGINGKVYGFEPDPLNYNACTKNISLNNFKNIEVDNLGLGNAEGRFKLLLDSISNRGRNKISRTINGKEFTEVTIVTLDKWLLDKNIQIINLIKIDVEGFENNVIMGGVNVIKKFKPTLFIELDDNNLKQQGSSAANLVEYISDLGYRITNAENDKEVSKSDHFINSHFDIICKPIRNI